MSQDPRLVLKLCALFCAMMVVCFDAEAQWTAVDTGVEDDLYAVYFLDEFYGLATGWGASVGAVTIKTIDGGESWTTVTHANGSFMFDVYCSPDYLTAYISGYRGAACTGKSSNGGVTWSLENHNESFGFYAVSFPTEQVGYSCGYNGAIFKSMNAGEDWEPLNTGTTTLVFTALEAPDEMHAYAMAGEQFFNPLFFYRTSDGGATWENVHDFSGPMAQIAFLDADEGLAVGNANGEAIFKTYDGGETWTRKHSGPGSRVLQDVCFAGDRCWAVGDAGRVLRSDDRGEHWTLDAIMTPTATLLGVSEAGGTVYASGAGGRIFKQNMTPSDAGNMPPVVQAFALQQNFPNPFNPTTEISFSIAKAGHVKLEIFNTKGELVEVLADREFAVGQHSVNYDASGKTSGVYLYRLTSSGASETRKMILMK